MAERKENNAGLAVVTVLAGLGAIFWIGWLGFLLGAMSDHPQEQRYQPYRYAADKPLEIDPTTASGSNAQALQNRAPCESPRGREESDLCAQWISAKAADTSAWWTKWSVIVGFVTMIGLLWQIALSRKAVEDTAKANEITREVFEIENRPILAFEGIRLEPWRPDGVLIKAGWVNQGRLPALPVRTQIYRSYTVGNPTDGDIAALRAKVPAQSEGEALKIIPTGGLHLTPGAALMAGELGCQDRGEALEKEGYPRYWPEKFALIIARVEYRAAIGTSKIWETEQVIAVMPYYSGPGLIRSDDFGHGPPTALRMT
jgi:hypothetical protein